MMMAARAPQPDLLAWPAIADAAEAVRAAEQVRDEAERRYHYAPHGRREARLRELKEAVQAALRAELELRRRRRAAMT